MSDNKNTEPPTPKPTSSLSALDSPSSYLHASKEDKKAIAAAYSEIFRVPKKKRKSADAEGSNKGEGEKSPKKRKAKNAVPSPEHARPACGKTESVAKTESVVKTKEDPTCVLRKGDLVRLDSAHVHSGRIQGGLARVTKINPPADESAKSEYCYDIEYVLGGKVSNIPRQELIYTTAEAEGLISTNLRERRSSRGVKDEEKKSPPKQRKRDAVSRRPSSKDGSVSSRASKRVPTKKAKVVPKRNSRRTSTDDEQSSDANQADSSRAMDMYVRHKREMERSLGRLEKVDRFGFFFDTCPPELDEDYDDEEVSFPDRPPFNFAVLKKRFEAGRYDIDFVKAEVERRKELKATLKESGLDTVKEETGAMDTDGGNDEDYEALLYDEVAQSMYHPVGVDWDTFNTDVIGMCDAAMKRDPDGTVFESGHLGNAANKIKKLMEEMYTNYGSKRRAEMEANEARLKYENILNNCGNREAAMQGQWRKHAFPERKYERLESSSVVCDGLSEMDKSYAIYELGTSIPDSFVGLAYTYDDSGQHSETWMKTVVDETTAKPKSRRKKKGSESTDAEKGTNKEQSAAAALAKDDAVAKAQVQNTMQSLLIQVQDKVMTDLGVMHQPEARSANWDDGDDRRNYRGGAVEVEQGSNFNSLPEVAEQEVWGIDCYTRKNVMTLIEAEFSSEIALEFLEKWLLPAINACPVDLAHDITTAARILEGLPIGCSKTSEKETPKIDEATPDETTPDETTPDGATPDEATSDEAKPDAEKKTDAEQEKTQPVSPRKKAPESSVFLRNALESKIKNSGPPWLKAAARMLRLAAEALDDDDGFFRIHPKGHGSVVIGEQGLKANSLVTYYRGEVYPAWRWCEKLDAIEKTQKALDLRPNLPDFYNMAMERPKKDPRGYGLLFVDASRKSGLGSSFSHSCNPSCEVRVVALNGKLSLAMTTLRDLEQGEELTFDYNAITESVTEYRFAICLCGHKKCRGSFLHFASAPCYQQVLSRNCPMASRFANLVRGCMKQVMSREDSDILLKHGFNTAAFGAVSFNHHSKDRPTPAKDARTTIGELLLELSASPSRPTNSTVSMGPVPSSNVIPDSAEDSIENVPIWLRTYVADTLRYIEYERRALPVALLCNQMERIEQQKAHQKKELQRGKKKPEKIVPSDPDLPKSEKSKPIAGSKPTSSYFFYLNSNRDEFMSIVQEETGGKLKGLSLSQAINKYGSQAWSKLNDEEKQSWKDKAIADWKENGGQEKAKLEEERQRANGSMIQPDAADDKENNSTGNAEVIVEQKEISFADAEAEGLSAMEQRIQQLAQSLSRVGRVLDRHREAEYRKIKGTVVNPSVLRSLVPSPLKIMSDEEVVNWMWNEEKGVVRNLFALVEEHFPKESLLRKLLSNTRSTYPVLSAFAKYSDPKMHSSVEPRKGKSACSSEDARGVLREALLEFRSDINAFLAFAEKSHFDAIRKKKNDAANRRKEEKKEKENTKLKTQTSGIRGDDATMSDVTSNDASINEPVAEFQSGRTDNMIVESSNADDLMRIRGGGETILGPETTLNDNTASMLQNVPLKPNESAFLESADSSQAHSVSVATTCHNVDEAKDGLTQLDTRVETLLQEKKSIITPSSSQIQAAIVQPASLPVPPMNRDTSILASEEKLPTESKGLAVSETSKLDALTLMASLAAAAPPAELIKHSQASEESAGIKFPFATASVTANAATSMSSILPPSPEASDPVQPLQQAAPPPVNSDANLPREIERMLEAGGIPPEAADPVQPLQQAAPPPVNSNSVLPPEIERTVEAGGLPSPEEPKRKKPVKMNDEQVAYLKSWLLHPDHILNPYPTEAEKIKIMCDIGVEQIPLERWLSRQRKPVILSPDKEPVDMKWEGADCAHWSHFRKQRYMLEATADLLLMYACTNTFFLMEPFNRFDSTPIEVYARELGNEVPCHMAAKYKATSSSIDDAPQPNADNERKKRNEEPVSKETDKFCSPEDVITSVTVNYSEEYVISQLLQWFNGGIGQPQGLPDIFGCVMLPPVSGCWDEIKDSGESKVGTYTRTTDYATKTRLLLADWIDDRTKRGSPWNEDLARYFCKAGASPDPSMPMGSPVIDYLVTGIEENIQYVSSSLRDKDGKGTDSPARSRSKASASDRLQSTVDAGMPAQAVANWVQCEDPACLKWRKLPWHVDIDLLPEKFFCKDNIWTTGKRSCDVPEDQWDMSDAPVKFDTVEEDFAVGVWFDVQRDGKVGYHEAQVTEMDFSSAVKRVKFHFWRLSNASDEWVEVGSPRIAPHHTYTPRPVEGYGVPKKDKKKNKEKNCKAKSITVNTIDEANKRKAEEGINPDASGSPKKSKLNEGVAPQSSPKPDANSKKAPFPQATVEYLNNWFEKNISNPYPSQQEKLIIMASTGLNKRQLSDWLSKARKKQKTQAKTSSNTASVLLQLKSTLPAIAPAIAQSSSEVIAATNVTPAVLNDGVTTILSVAKKPDTLSQTASKSSATPSPSNNIGLPENAKRYLEKWIQEHKLNPFPSKDEKDRIIRDLSLGQSDLRKLEGWFSRARKKLKNDPKAPAFSIYNNSQEGKPSPVDVEKYLNAWLLRPENKNNLNPSYEERAKMEKESGIESRRIESWFYRLRKKIKKQQDKVNGTGQKAVMSPQPSKTMQPKTGISQGAGSMSNQPVAIPTSIIAPTQAPQASNQTVLNSLANAAHNQASHVPPQGNQTGQSQATQSTTNVSSNLDLLFEAASIHSAAKEAAKESYTRMEREVVSQYNDTNDNRNAGQINQSIARQPHPMNVNALSNEGASRSAQGIQMRYSPVFGQQVHHRNVSRGPTPPNIHPHQAYHDRQPSSSFVPIRTDNMGRPASRGPTPTYHNAHPAHHSNGPIHYGNQYQRASPTYTNTPQYASQEQSRYPHPPESVQHQGNYRGENAQYHQQYQPRYNMHNGQQNGSEHQH